MSCRKLRKDTNRPDGAREYASSYGSVHSIPQVLFDSGWKSSGDLRCDKKPAGAASVTDRRILVYQEVGVGSIEGGMEYGTCWIDALNQSAISHVSSDMFPTPRLTSQY